MGYDSKKRSHKNVISELKRHTGGKWLIHGTKHHRNTHSQAWDSPVNITVENLNMT